MAGSDDACISDLLTQPASEVGLLRVSEEVNLIEHDQVGTAQLALHRTPDILVRSLFANRLGIGQHYDPVQMIWRRTTEIALPYRISDARCLDDDVLRQW